MTEQAASDQAQLKIQQQSFEEDGTEPSDLGREQLVDEVVLSPLQKYRKYGRFPWELILTAIMILSTSLTTEATVQTKYPQQREIQTFFNFHLLAHDSFDIYEGATVFTWRTHQYHTLQEMMDFFNRTLEVMAGMPSLNFHPIDEVEANRTNHTIKKVYRDGNSSVEEYTLPQLVESGELTVLLKESIFNVRIMQIRFVLFNFSQNVQRLDVVIDVEIRQKFMMFVEIDTEFVKTNFTSDGVVEEVDAEPAEANATNLKIRKLPDTHRGNPGPPRISYVAALLLIGLTVKSMLRRHSLYKQNPTAIEGVADGRQFSGMTLREKINLLGIWNFLMVGLCLGSFIGGGMATFFCWIMPIRYLQYTNNPFLISFLMRKVVIIQAILLLNVLIVLTGFVMFSMVVFTQTKKFENVRLAYFEYIFNNFQYGIYENFIALEHYGGFAQFMYYCLLFYMVSCANQMLPSLLCNIVISRGRYQDLQEFIAGVKIPCPVCRSITNTSPKKPRVGVQQSAMEESQVYLEVASPTLSPFLTPTTEPMRAAKKQATGFTPLKKRTMFQIKQQDTPVLPATKAERFRLFMLKLELLMSKFEEGMMELEINKQPQHSKFLTGHLLICQARLLKLHGKLEREPPSAKSLP